MAHNEHNDGPHITSRQMVRSDIVLENRPVWLIANQWPPSLEDQCVHVCSTHTHTHYEWDRCMYACVCVNWWGTNYARHSLFRQIDSAKLDWWLGRLQITASSRIDREKASREQRTNDIRLIVDDHIYFPFATCMIEYSSIHADWLTRQKPTVNIR